MTNVLTQEDVALALATLLSEVPPLALADIAMSIEATDDRTFEMVPALEGLGYLFEGRAEGRVTVIEPYLELFLDSIFEVLGKSAAADDTLCYALAEIIRKSGLDPKALLLQIHNGCVQPRLIPEGSMRYFVPLSGARLGFKLRPRHKALWTKVLNQRINIR